MLALNTALVVFLLGMMAAVMGNVQHATRPQEAAAAHTPTAAIEPQRGEPEPVAPSWDLAEQRRAAKEYDLALGLYRQLMGPAQSRPADSSAADLLLLRQGQCLQQLGHAGESLELFQQAAKSSSAAVRAAANAMLAGGAAQESRWTQARSYSYAAIASLGLLDKTLPLETDCDFASATAMTRQVMSLFNYDASALPAAQMSDPFAGLDHAALEQLLSQGANRLDEALLAPQVHRTENASARRYNVACSQAPLEELLNRFSAESGVEIQWDSVSPSARRRAVTLVMNDVGEQRLAEVACGMASLYARFIGDSILVHDGQSDMPAARKRDLLAQEAISLWRRLLLRVPQDARVPQGHLAMAAVYEMSGDTSSALAEYRLICDRYAQDPAAPQALMQSARLRIRICDYAGANTDLLDLLDGHPNYPACDEAYLQLALVATQSGQTDEAIRCFQKLYFLDLSLASKTQASLGLGQCFYRKNDLKEAGKWLAFYLKNTTDAAGEDIRQANFMLGKCLAASGDAGGAVQAYRRSLAADLTRKHVSETTLELAAFLLEINDCVGAMGALGRLAAENLTESQTLAEALLESRVLRAMGLADKAASLIRSKSAELSSEHAAVLEVELARCRTAAGDLPAARTALAAALPRLGGADAWNATCDLAEVCLKLQDYSQAVTLCQELLKTSCQGDPRRRALEALAAAYLAQKDYKNAADTYALMPAPPAKEDHE